MIKDYSSWNFGHRLFWLGLLISILWHFFWFFAVKITVNPAAMLARQKPRVVSLGPVLDDTIFRTLAENKPKYTETFYRRLSDFSFATDLKVETLSRFSSGEVVSVPLSKRALDAMREALGGVKGIPDFGAIPFPGSSAEEAKIEGEAASLQILSKPPKPQFPFGVNPEYKFAETVVEFAVDAKGSISRAQVFVSSGSQEADAVWVSYVREWQFSPFSTSASETQEKIGRIRLLFDERGR